MLQQAGQPRFTQEPRFEIAALTHGHLHRQRPLEVFIADADDSAHAAAGDFALQAVAANSGGQVLGRRAHRSRAVRIVVAHPRRLKAPQLAQRRKQWYDVLLLGEEAFELRCQSRVVA